MKISFRDLPCKLTTRIYVDDLFVGEVRKDIWNNTWSIHPDFKVSTVYYPELAEIYMTSYKAGKALVGAYNKKKSRKRGGTGDEHDLTELGLNDILSFLRLER